MKYIISFLIVFSLVVSCSHKQRSTDYFIFSKRDSINSTWKYDSNYRDYYPPPPPPPPPPYLEWYSNIVLIFDTANTIYLYQTDLIENMINHNRTHLYPRFPSFLNLKPTNLITLHSDYLISFLTDNDEYFRLDTNFREFNRIFYIVSDFDTIVNPGFYNILSHIKSNKLNKARAFYLSRRTTEEEKNVLSCKRIGISYDPHDFNWSRNFLDGETKPLTSRYDSLERISVFLVKSKEIFRPDITELPPIQ